MTLVLDAGALIAVDRRDRHVGALLRLAHTQGHRVTTSAAVIAEVWRDGTRQANLARVLAGVGARALDDPAAREVGTLLARSHTADVADAHVAVITEAGDHVLTGDVGDIAQLLDVRGIIAGVVRV